MDRSSRIKQSVKRSSIGIELRKGWNSVHYLFCTSSVLAPFAVWIALRHFSEVVHSFPKAVCLHIVWEFFPCLVCYQIRVLAWCKIALDEIAWYTTASGTGVAFFSIFCTIRSWSTRAVTWVSITQPTLVRVIAASIVFLIFSVYIFLWWCFWLSSNSGFSFCNIGNLRVIRHLLPFKGEFLNGECWSGGFRFANWFYHWALFPILPIKICWQADFSWRIFGHGIFSNTQPYFAEIED